MADLYFIRGDYGHPWRLKKFVEYQHEVPETHYRFIGEYIKKFVGDKDEAVRLCWYLSCTYNEITACFLHEKENLLLKNTNKFWKKYKPKLVFNSSRMYAKSMDWFPELIGQFEIETKERPYKWLKHFCKGDNSREMLYKRLEKLKYTGRFSIELFVECVIYLQDFFDVEIIETVEQLDWCECSNMTSALLNILYLDEEANVFDKTGKLDKSFNPLLSDMVREIQKEIQTTYPDQSVDDIVYFMGKLCSFRNLFKGSRYAGFHHDRELEAIKHYEQHFPKKQYLWDKMYELRLELFNHKYLGELNGWNGIRKDRKKLFLSRGLTGAE